MGHGVLLQTALYVVFTVGVTVIEFPVAPLDQITVPVQPVAVNIAPNPEQIIVLLVETVGITGAVFTVIDNIRAVPEPQVLFALTLNVPEVDTPE